MYTEKTKSYEKQAQIHEFSKDLRNCALICDPGTGKTKMTLDTIGHLYREGKVNTVVVLAPKAIYLQWEIEIEKHLGLDANEYTVLRSVLNDVQREQQVHFWANSPELLILLMNTEQFSKKDSNAARTAQVFLDARSRSKSMVVLDESTSIKTPGARRTRNIQAFFELFMYRRILTGTLVTGNPVDLFSQFRALDQSILGNSVTRFKKIFCQFEAGWKGMGKVTGFKDLDLLFRYIGKVTCQLKITDMLDMPPKVYTEIPVDMTPAQKAVYERVNDYDEIYDTLVTCDLCQGTAKIETMDGIVSCPECYKGYKTDFIDVILVKLLRLQQVTSGFIPDMSGSEEKSRAIDGDNPKVDAVLDILNTASMPTLVWTNGRPEARLLHERIKGSLLFSGDVSHRQREANKEAFMAGESDCLILTLHTGARGLNLQRATRAIYFSVNWSYEQRDQSEKRIWRVGQSNKVLYYDIIVPGSIDIDLRDAYERKSDIAHMLIDRRLQAYQEK